ncbi:polysaccharide biosynthesis tyrosine autokinase [Corynebacterium sp.]|uniref:polysaccharide biosynthesis tyrosine autokinase n=1 Tax=Corynebacterium sp. TaxID=1720 RepID=UPI0028B17FE6|nr:polysaccharide biosynthesis tyrosine autokinase [Corynebacterium sp.]
MRRSSDAGRSPLTTSLNSPSLVAVLLGAVAVVVGLVARATITGRFGGFGNDAGTIREIMTSPFSAMDLGYGSYSVIAQFYTALGMEDAPTAASVFGAVIGSTALGIVLVRVGGVHAGRISLVLALATPVLIGLYQATYTKEILISLGMFVIVLMPVNLAGEIVVVAALALLGTEYRTYWSVVAVIYVVLRLLLARRSTVSGRRIAATPWRVLRILALLSALAGLAVWIGTGDPADYFRTAVNEGEARQAMTGSIIGRFIDLPEPFGGVVNVVLTTMFFIVPLPMAAKFSPYYLVIGLLFALIWISAVAAATATARAHGGDRHRVPVRDRRMMARFAAVPLSFLVVQGLFEPDWGSALRHATPMVPLIVGAVALMEKYRTQQTEHNNQKRIPMTTPSSPSEQNHLATYLGYLRTSFWMLIVGAVIGGLLGWGASALMTKQYTATSQLYVGAANTGNSTDAYRGTLLSQSQVGTYAEIATSRALGERVARDLGLDQSPAEVASMLTAGANRDTVILNINAVAGDAEEARDLANSAAAQLTAMVAELNTTTAPDGPSSAPQLAPLNDALTPDAPSSPKILQNVGIGAGAGLILGLVAAVVRGMTDNRIRDRRQIADIVGAPAIGTISTSDNLSGSAGSHVLDFAAAPVIAAEQFRELRTNLRFLDVDNPPTVIAVTSGMPGEGKSTVATNLALALADDGERVCLVDADLRRPRVADYLGGDLQSEVGLSTVLSGAAGVDDIVQESGRDGLTVVTSGPQPPNPAELLGSRRFRDVLTDLDARYDYVIVDASPVIPVTDAALVSSAVDGLILAVSHGDTTVDQLTRTTSNLTQVGAHVLGTVFTMTPKSEGKGYYRNGYGYGYGNTAAAVQRASQAATASGSSVDASATGAPAQHAVDARETVGADR